MLRILMNPIAKIIARSMGKSDERTERGKELPRGVTERADLPYIADGNRGHLLDVYTPASASVSQKLPLIVDVHGGGLIYGYKEINKRFCYELARLGFVVASVNYRLVPEVSLPEQIADVTAAYRYIAEHSAELGADTDRVYLAGDSAGAFLSLYALAASESEEVRGAFGVSGGKLRAKGLFLVSGMYDMLAGGYMKHLCSYALGRGHRKKSWMKYLDVRKLLGAFELPPVFMSSSEEDMLAAQSDAFDKLLTELNLPHVYDYTPKAGNDEPRRAFVHVYPVRFPEWEESLALMRRAFDYLENDR